jgi:hypothetical protein
MYLIEKKREGIDLTNRYSFLQSEREILYILIIGVRSLQLLRSKCKNPLILQVMISVHTYIRFMYIWFMFMLTLASCFTMGRMGGEHIPKKWHQIQLSARPRPPFWGMWPSTPTWALADSSMLLDLNARKRSRFHQTPQNRVERERERKGQRDRERAGERKDGWEIERVGGLGYWIPDRYHVAICAGGESQGLFFQMSCVATDGKQIVVFLFGKLGLSSIDLLLRADVQLGSDWKL